MANRNYRGIYLIGDKAKGLISHVQVIDFNGNGNPLRPPEYVTRGIKPDYKTLPWREDIKASRAQPKS